MKSYKFKVGQTVTFKGEEVTVTGHTYSGRKGLLYALSNGEVAKANELTKVTSGIKEGVVPKTFPVPADLKEEATTSEDPAVDTVTPVAKTEEKVEEKTETKKASTTKKTEDK